MRTWRTPRSPPKSIRIHLPNTSAVLLKRHSVSVLPSVTLRRPLRVFGPEEAAASKARLDPRKEASVNRPKLSISVPKKRPAEKSSAPACTHSPAITGAQHSTAKPSQ